MFELLGISSQALFGQLLIGLINGSFYALLSLGLAVIFGMLNIINFTHGAQYMLGAFAAYFVLQYAGLGYWWAILLAPLIVGITGIIVERLFLQWLYKLDHLYGLLITFGLALIFEGTFRNFFGSSGLPYSVPPTLQGGQNPGFMFLPNYRAWVVVFSLAVCLTTWFVIERTKLGSYLRAATENPTLVRAFGINVPRMITLTYGFGVALAALARRGNCIRHYGLRDHYRADICLSRVPDEGVVLRAVRVRVQPADRLCRVVIVRPRAVLRLGELYRRPRGQGLGLSAGARNPV